MQFRNASRSAKHTTRSTEPSLTPGYCPGCENPVHGNVAAAAIALSSAEIALFAPPRICTYDSKSTAFALTVKSPFPQFGASANPASPLIITFCPGRLQTYNAAASRPAYFTYKGDTGQNYQFQVNNTLYPNWQSTKAADWFQH
eukprot:SAG22_NODE_3692_length_1574_cov_13.357966_2_plen_143_part_01